MDKVSKVDLSQEELRLILACMGFSLKTGQLQLGDIVNMAPLATKLDALLIKTKEPETNGKAEEGKLVS